ncbi:unnamed protein product [Fraxinus pennsylvanica]|uniref:Uncharacterized protein n=1 Tax=Fraxinus pennsylvanica TaxID=56036 RepID=A0AAD1YMX7_9LAMI|nr:unnamed protein product [Fraxinus pennsylvanica]
MPARNVLRVLSAVVGGATSTRNWTVSLSPGDSGIKTRNSHVGSFSFGLSPSPVKKSPIGGVVVFVGGFFRQLFLVVEVLLGCDGGDYNSGDGVSYGGNGDVAVILWCDLVVGATSPRSPEGCDISK